MATVSDTAKRGLDYLFTKAATTHLVLQPTDHIDIEPLRQNLPITPDEPELYIITIANFFFKVLIIFHVNPDAKTSAYFSRPDSELGFADVFPEVGNMCCGAMNRELGKTFPHLGMSTPYQLERDCMDFLDLLRPAHIAQYKIVINHDITLHATVCVCAYQTLDFRVDTRPVLAEETGVLELF